MRFDIMRGRSRPPTRISEQQMFLHMVKRQTQVIEHIVDQHAKEVVALEQIAVVLLTMLQELKN